MRFRNKAILITAALVGVGLLAVTSLQPGRSEGPEVRLNRLDKGGLDFSRIISLPAGTWRAEFQIQVPSGSRIWITDGPIGVEMLGAGGDWTRTPTNSTAQPSSSPWRGRTISRTMWLALPAGVKSCRFTIGYRRPTLKERGMMVLDKWGLSRRYPAVSGWIAQHLPANEQWLSCRREVEVAACPIKPEVYGEVAAPTNRVSPEGGPGAAR